MKKGIFSVLKHYVMAYNTVLLTLVRTVLFNAHCYNIGAGWIRKADFPENELQPLTFTVNSTMSHS